MNEKGETAGSAFVCCRRPAIVIMDYSSDWHNPERRINRVCTHCWTHWFGAPTAVRQYTKKEWDDYINGPET